MQKGIKTSEFWISALAPVLAVILGQFTSDHTQTIVAQIGTFLVAIGYALSRTVVKSSAQKAEAITSLNSPPAPPIIEDQKKSS